MKNNVEKWFLNFEVLRTGTIYFFCHHLHLRKWNAASSLKQVIQDGALFHLFYCYSSPNPDTEGPRTWSSDLFLTLSQSRWSLCSLAGSTTFRIMTLKFIFSAPNSTKNSCHFCPSACCTSALPFLIPIYTAVCPKPSSSLSLLSWSPISVNGLLHSFSCPGPKTLVNKSLMASFLSHPISNLHLFVNQSCCLDLWNVSRIWSFLITHNNIILGQSKYHLYPGYCTTPYLHSYPPTVY